MKEDTCSLGWVPDQEVKNCPVCHVAFGGVLTLRKHHCRQCGRVVCNKCSDNLIDIPGPHSKARVCDPCHKVQQDAKAAQITEDISHNRRVAEVLKANLKEKHQEAEWFRIFVQKVADFGEGEDTFENQEYEDTNAEVVQHTPAGEGTPGKIHQAAIEATVRKNWKKACEALKGFENDIASLSKEAAEVEARLAQQIAERERLQKVVGSLECDLRGFPEVTSTRDMASRKVSTLQQELDGLVYRAAVVSQEMEASAASRNQGYQLGQRLVGSQELDRRCSRRLRACTSSGIQGSRKLWVSMRTTFANCLTRFRQMLAW